MHPPRIIARLDIKSFHVVKGIRLEGLRKVGDPREKARRYYEDGVDEIIYMDIVATLYQRNSILSVVKDAARDIFVPLTVGGGIRSVDDIVDALRSGADKVAINTAAIRRPEFIREASQAVGSQAIVLSVEAKRQNGWWEAQTDNGREHTGRDVLEWVAQAEDLGAGEVLVTSVDRAGTRTGFDLDLLRQVRSRVGIPVIASGGAGSADDVADVLDGPAADAVAIASLLHYDIEPLPGLREKLRARGHEVRN